MSSSCPSVSLFVHTLPHLGVSELRFYIYFVVQNNMFAVHTCVFGVVCSTFIKLVDHFIIITFVVSINHQLFLLTIPYTVIHNYIRNSNALSMVSVEYELCSVRVRMYVWVILHFCCIVARYCSSYIYIIQSIYVGMVSKSIPLQSKTIKLIGELQYIM